MLSLLNQPIDTQVTKSSAPEQGEVVPSISWIESHPVTHVRIDSLVFADSPRLNGQDQEHIRALAEIDSGLPPITVHRTTMRVIDGTHRVHAALLNGRATIEARVLDCDERSAFVLAVLTNVTHGMPLSKQDRAAAAERIIRTHPQWSDRAIAAATALSDKTISGIRARSTSETPQSNSRLGRDGRVRPLDSAHRRQQAAAILHETPDAGLRKVARATGLSPATVRDVRQRMDRGEDPVPGRYRIAAGSSAPADAEAAGEPIRNPSATGRAKRPEVAVDRQQLLAKLSHDPSLRHSEAGRNALRYLHHYAVDSEALYGLARGLPDHCAPVVADLALSCAAAWIVLADRLQQRTE